MTALELIPPFKKRQPKGCKGARGDLTLQIPLNPPFIKGGGAVRAIFNKVPF